MKTLLQLIGIYLNTLGWIFPKAAGRQSFMLFCTPFAAKIKSHQKSFLNTSTKTRIHFEGKAVQMYRWGTGRRTILCVHGWQSNTFRWKRFIQAVDHEKYTVVAVDAPAHGGSEGHIMNIPIYARLLKQVFSAIGDVDILVGHSIGGFASMNMMYENPYLRPVKAVFLASPGNAEEFISYYKKMINLSTRTERLMRDYFVHYVGRPVSDYQTTIYGPELGIPGLIIHDRGDDEAPSVHAENLHRSWPGSELILTDGLGHQLKGKPVLNAILDFIEKGEREHASIPLPNSRSAQVHD